MFLATIFYDTLSFAYWLPYQQPIIENRTPLLAVFKIRTLQLEVKTDR